MDAIPLALEPWLLSINDVIESDRANRREAAQAAADAKEANKQKGGRHRR